jgi:hypothetical protein
MGRLFFCFLEGHLGIKNVNAWLVGKNLTGCMDGPWAVIGLVLSVEDARHLCRDWSYFIKDCDTVLTGVVENSALISELGPVHYPKALPMESGGL